MITNIDIDETLVAEALRLTGARSKREVVDRALRDLVARSKRPRLSSMFGIASLDPDYDHKAARGGGVWQCVEEPRATYVSTPAQPAAKRRKKSA